ncbi:hypothetical protein [Pseudohoeflea coraliihabitans]|uniref:Uncharacterized protein n=1 Tax=Pseudohoeflea coraliihabitans TaxID=2860393 RepID=A0ABS6WPN4_9HYPH|nr:hypothetical protein [Pseudohoeflea sp. DP4N28-3]MBW3097922.1 hypothetical protein [Pseudohoeflea sp. DP4N28-3]
MLREVIGQCGGRAVLLLDTITSLTMDDRGAVVITGSHGGASSGAIALKCFPGLVVFNDAGVGKDRAGIVALSMFAEHGVAAAAVDKDSARIGDAADMWASGIIAHVNGPAGAAGVRFGHSVLEAVAALDTSKL